MSFAYETQMTAYKLLTKIMNVKEDETVVIYSDTASDMEVVKATAGAAAALGAIPIVLTTVTQPKVYGDYSKPIREAIKNADVVVEFGGKSDILYTSTYYEMRNAGRARYTCLSALTTETFLQVLGRIDIDKTLQLGDKLVELTNRARKIRIRSAGGTDLVAEMGDRKAHQDGGIARKPGDVVMLPGQVGWCPMEETVNGTIAIDGEIDRPRTVMPSVPIELTMKEGMITDVKGGSEAEAYKRWLESFNHPNMYQIAHYTYGFNPGIIDFLGNLTVDERQFGCFLFGFGHQGDITGGKGRPAPSHCDAVVRNPSVWLDDLQIEKDGKWIHPDLVRVTQEMKVPGY